MMLSAWCLPADFIIKKISLFISGESKKFHEILSLWLMNNAFDIENEIFIVARFYSRQLMTKKPH